MARASTPRAAPKKRSAGELIVNLDEFASLCGVTSETMRSHLKQAPARAPWILERGARGRGYKIAALLGVEWWKQRSASSANDDGRNAQLAALRLQMLGGDANEDDLLLSGKQRGDEFKAGLAELEYREAMGELARVSDYEADTVILPGSDRLRAEQRDAAMNQPIATAAINRKTTFVIGTGLMVIPAVDGTKLGLSPEDQAEWELRLATDFDSYMASKDVDAERKSTGYGLQSVAARGTYTSGDVRALFESRGIEIVELLGPGDKNHSDHFHVAWTKGKLSLDAFTDAAKRAKEEAEQLTELRLFTDGNALGRALSDARRSIDGQRDDFNVAARSVFGAQLDDGAIGRLVAEHDQAQRIEADRWNAENARRVQQQEADLQNLAGLWNTAFSGGTRGIWDTFKQQGLAVISELLARWVLFGNFEGFEGGGSDLLGSIGRLIGGAAGGSTSIDMTKTNAMLDNLIVPRFAGGTAYSPGGWADVGEFGKERVWLPRGSRVSSARDTQRMAANDPAPTQKIDVHQHFNVPVGTGLVTRDEMYQFGVAVKTQTMTAISEANRRRG